MTVKNVRSDYPNKAEEITQLTLNIQTDDKLLIREKEEAMEEQYYWILTLNRNYPLNILHFVLTTQLETHTVTWLIDCFQW